MEFRLVYQGRLKANATPRDKHPIRKALHPQLKDLWRHPPLTDYASYLTPKGTYVGGPLPELVTNVGAFSFTSLVHSDLQLLAELEVVILKPDGAGAVTRRVATSMTSSRRSSTLYDNRVTSLSYRARRHPSQTKNPCSSACLRTISS
jgi:hypothetical protein